MKMYKENFGFNKFNKKILLSIFSISIFFFVVFLSVGFSAFELDLIMKDIKAEVRFVDTDAAVWSFKSMDLNNGAVASNTDYNYNRIYGDIILPNSNSSVVYEVQVTNLGNARIGISSITGLDESLEYTLTGYEIGDVLKDEDGNYKLGTVMTFYITIQYAEGTTPISTSQPFNMLVDFRPLYTITYHGVPGDEDFPIEIMEGRDLVLNTELTSIDRLKITQDTVFLTYGEHYTYDETTQTLTVKNVEGDLLLSYRDITYLTLLTDASGYFKEYKYKTKIKNIYFVDYVDITNAEKTYDLSEEQDNSIIGWIISNGNSTYDLYVGSIYDIYTKNFENAFANMTGVRSISFKNLNTSESTSFAYTFYGTHVTSLDLSTFNTARATTMQDMFANMTKLETLDVRNFNTENVTNMWYMFGGATQLKELDISTFDTSSAKSMGYMFSGMTNLEKLTFGPGFTASRVTSMEYMFNGLTSLKTLDLRSLKTDSLTNTKYMFYNCNALTSLDLSGLNTSNVTDMSYMFYSMSNLSTLNISNFNTKKVTRMDYMFAGCAKLSNLDLKHFNTSTVTNMEGMFSYMSELLTLDLSTFDLTLVSNMKSFVTGCIKIETIDFRTANFTNVTNSTSMFDSVPVTIEVIVADETAKTWIQERLGEGIGTVTIYQSSESDAGTETTT